MGVIKGFPLLFFFQIENAIIISIQESRSCNLMLSYLGTGAKEYMEVKTQRRTKVVGNYSGQLSPYKLSGLDKRRRKPLASPALRMHASPVNAFFKPCKLLFVCLWEHTQCFPKQKQKQRHNYFLKSSKAKDRQQQTGVSKY